MSRLQDFDPKITVNATDELIVTDSNHKSWRTTFANFLASISSLANLTITTLFHVTGTTELANTEVNGDLEVNGDIIQNGQAYETHAEKVYTKDDVINLRDGAVSALPSGKYAGVIAKHYNQDGDDGALVFDQNGEARVGDYNETEVTVYSPDGTNFYTDAGMTEAATIPAGITPELVSGTEYKYTAVDDDTEPLLTRDEEVNMLDGAFLKWNATNKRAESAQNVIAQINTIIANSSTFTGIAVTAGSTLSVMFTSDIAALIVEGLTLNYNNENIPVKLYKNNSLVNFNPVYNLVYIQAYTRIEFLYDGTQFIIIGNPIVYRTNRFTVRADGSVDGGAIGDVKPIALTSIPYGWLECNGQAVSRSEYADLFAYFNSETVEVAGVTKTLLQIYGEGDASTTFNLPDYREVALVGAGQNDTDSALATHDIYTVGQFKDDQLQRLTGEVRQDVEGIGNITMDANGIFKLVRQNNYPRVVSASIFSGTRYDFGFDSALIARSGDVTRGKRKGVKFIIKVL